MLKDFLLKKAQGLPVIEKPLDVHRFVEAKIGDVNFAIEMDYVKELVNIPPLAMVPGAPFNFLGIFNLRGDMVVLLDIREQFNIKNVMRTPLSRVIVVKVENETLGLFVDESQRILDVPRADFTENVEQKEDNIFSYQIKTDDKQLGVLNLKKLFFDYKIM